MKEIAKEACDAINECAHQTKALLEEAKDIVSAAVEEANKKIEAANELRETAAANMNSAADEAEAFFDDKSEKWQESPAGQTYVEWKDRLRELADDMDRDIDLIATEDLEPPEWVTSIDEAGTDAYRYPE